MKTIEGDLVKFAVDGCFDVIVHGCNCDCVMGAGIARQIKSVFPEAYAADLATTKGDAAKLGTISVGEVNRDGISLWVVNGYTQKTWRGSGVKVSEEALRLVMREVKMRFSGFKIGYPRIGAGLGGGNWDLLKTIINQELEGEDHTFVEYCPS